MLNDTYKTVLQIQFNMFNYYIFIYNILEMLLHNVSFFNRLSMKLNSPTSYFGQVNIY